MRINLTEAELFICRMLGVMRRSEAMHKVSNKQVGKDDTWSIDIDGVVSEYCVAKMLNICPDLTVSVRSGGVDLISSKGKTILWSVLAGLGVGVALGMLLAPNKGSETRSKIKTLADDLEDFIKKNTEKKDGDSAESTT